MRLVISGIAGVVAALTMVWAAPAGAQVVEQGPVRAGCEDGYRLDPDGTSTSWSTCGAKAGDAEVHCGTWNSWKSGSHFIASRDFTGCERTTGGEAPQRCGRETGTPAYEDPQTSDTLRCEPLPETSLRRDVEAGPCAGELRVDGTTATCVAGPCTASALAYTTNVGSHAVDCASEDGKTTVNCYEESYGRGRSCGAATEHADARCARWDGRWANEFEDGCEVTPPGGETVRCGEYEWAGTAAHSGSGKGCHKPGTAQDGEPIGDPVAYCTEETEWWNGKDHADCSVVADDGTRIDCHKTKTYGNLPVADTSARDWRCTVAAGGGEPRTYECSVDPESVPPVGRCEEAP